MAPSNDNALLAAAPASAGLCARQRSSSNLSHTLHSHAATAYSTPTPPPSHPHPPTRRLSGAKLKFADHYRLGQVVGTGHYARVQLATSLKDSRKYAVKIIRKDSGKEALLLQLQSEQGRAASLQAAGA